QAGATEFLNNQPHGRAARDESLAQPPSAVFSASRTRSFLSPTDFRYRLLEIRARGPSEQSRSAFQTLLRRRTGANTPQHNWNSNRHLPIRPPRAPTDDRLEARVRQAYRGTFGTARR